MKEDEAKKVLLQQVGATRQMVALAKASIRRADAADGLMFRDLVDTFTRSQGFQKPEHVNLNNRLDPTTDIRNAAGAISSELSVAQAVWELIGWGHAMPMGQSNKKEPDQAWTDVIQGSGGTTSGWSFPELAYAVPDYILLSHAWHGEREVFLDPDIFVVDSGVDGADEEIPRFPT